MIKRRPSNGNAGEAAAAAFFEARGWTMYKTPPPFKVLGKHPSRGRSLLFGYFNKGGAPDFQGFMVSEAADLPIYRAVEVKESDGDRFRASGLKPEQRARLEVIPAPYGLVGIYWRDHAAFELFYYIQGRGAYVRGQGLKFPARRPASGARTDGGRLAASAAGLQPPRRAGRFSIVKG